MQREALIESFERRGPPHTGVDRHTPAWSPVQSQRARRTCTSTQEDLLDHRRDEEVNNATRRSVRLDHSLTSSKFGVVARRRSLVRARRVRSAYSFALPRSAAPRHYHSLHTWLVTTRQLAVCGVACLCLDLVISSLAWGITGTT